MRLFNKKTSAQIAMAVKTDRNLLIADYHLKCSIENLKIAANNGNNAAENILHMFFMSGLPMQSKGV